MKLLYSLLGMAMLVMVNGCSSSNKPASPAPISKSTILKSKDHDLVKNLLYSQYKDWKGVDYRLGGLSKEGIDCSGFVHITFLSKLGIELPRSTEQQAQIGTPINQSELQTGDLLFFKTGWSARHVGVYLENGAFLHASKSRGVMISSLDNLYWNSNYWQARRIR